jgi:hypothetical protein
MQRHDQTGGKNPNYRHGMYSTPEYKHWVWMKARCKQCARYVAKGLTVHPEWQDNFLAFYADIGPKPSDGRRYSVDRIDNDRGYEPGNVRWATTSEQNYNRGEVSQRARGLRTQAAATGLHLETVRYRIAKNIPLEAPKYGEHTHCRNGHEYTEETTYIDKKGIRMCRTCRNAAMRRYRARITKKEELKHLNQKPR